MNHLKLYHMNHLKLYHMNHLKLYHMNHLKLYLIYKQILEITKKNLNIIIVIN
jgi:hypothetical protein